MTIDTATGQLFEEDAPQPELEEKTPKVNYVPKVIWSNVFIILYLHLSSIYGVYLAFTDTQWKTFVYVVALYLMTKIGITAGVHRLWSHRSYKANLPLRALLLFFSTLTFEGKVYIWARDHRVHHKFPETDADPYNARRGLWFSHVGWLMQSKNPLVIEKGKGIDMSDLNQDKLVMFQKKYYWPLLFLTCFFLPTLIPVYFWGESVATSWYVAVCLRCVLSQNSIWLINSVGHKYGNRPYDVNFLATENTTVSLITLGEGWHNYHHAFPWDYKTSELGNYGFNLTTMFIDFFAKIGWAYDLKTVPPAVVRKRVLRTGDGTHKKQDTWGWNDSDLPREEREEATVINKQSF